jgi:dimethylglycine dehydrogenase
MKSQTDVVVIGGGIAGCSTLYHLTQEGITDCILLERDELTSGTTWHSAAQVTNFGPNQTMLGLKTHSINLYKELSEDVDYPINYHHGTGGIRIAGTTDHLDGYHHFVSQAKGMGIPFEVLDAKEAKKRHPLLNTDDILGGLWDPLDGDIDPAQLCQALARRARKAGAEVYRKTPVIGLSHCNDNSWIVETPEGEIRANKVVNAGGYRCNEIGKLMDCILPVASMEHQYMLTENIPELVDLGFRVPLIRCPISDFYQRQEKNGLLIGFYEQNCKTWGLEGIPEDFSNALCPDDLDRVLDVMEGAISRLPVLGDVGIHTVINGPITYTPDGLPLVGKIPGIRNAYCITGLRAGIGEGGGHGWLLAQIIAHGEACYDTWCLDPRRFGPEVSVSYTAKKAIEDYQNEFRFHMPHEDRPAGRPLKVSPLYVKLKNLGANFTTINGWERVNYYIENKNFHADLTFRYGNLHDVVKNEVEAVSSNLGMMEVNGFNRFEITGLGVHEWLDSIMCTKVPRRVGKVSLGYFLNELGNIKGEATLVTKNDGSILYGSAAASEHHDMDWLKDHLPEDKSIKITSSTNSYDVLVIAGPNSRSFLKVVSPQVDWDNFKWLTAQQILIDQVPVFAMAVSFSGELAWELHVDFKFVDSVFEKLSQIGQNFNMALFGSIAAESMRIEKGYLHWKSDLITEYNPFETGIGRFLDMSKDFIGKKALENFTENDFRRSLVQIVIDDVKSAPQPGDSLFVNDKVIGTVTSSSFGYRVDKTLALAFLDPEFSIIGLKLKASYLNKLVDGTVISTGPYDKNNTKVKLN